MLWHTSRVLKVLALVTILVIAPNYVLAGPVDTTASTSASDQGCNCAPLGRLTTRKNKQIKLNGRPAATGTTVASGSKIETPSGVVATVEVPDIVDLKIGVDSDVGFEYTNSLAKVKIAKGCVTFRSEKGRYGEVTLPSGTIMMLRPEETYTNCTAELPLVPHTARAATSVTVIDPTTFSDQGCRCAPTARLGRLTTTKNKDIKLNGTPAATGTTVTSGSKIETPSGVSAKVRVSEMADLTMDPESDVNFEYANDLARVKITKGCITFRSAKGHYGEVVLPSGTTMVLRPEDTYTNCTEGLAAAPYTARAAIPAGVITSPKSLGRLTTTKNKDIRLNGSPASSGTTVTSGSTIETPSGVSAKVKVPEVVDLTIDPESSVDFEYANGLARAKLTKGCMTLRPENGRYGEVRLRDGTLIMLWPEETYRNCADGLAAGPAAAGVIISFGSQAGQTGSPAVSQPTGAATPQAGGAAAAQSAEVATAQTANGATAQTANGATAQTASGATAQTANGATAQTANGATAQTANGATAQTANGATAQTANGATAQTANGATAQTANGATAQTANGATAQAANGATAQTANGATAQTANGATAQAANGATAQAANGATAQTANGATAASVGGQIGVGASAAGSSLAAQIGIFSALGGIAAGTATLAVTNSEPCTRATTVSNSTPVTTGNACN